MPEVKLTKLERLLLVNQLMILEKLYPEEAKSYSEHRKALQCGYALQYGWILEQIYDEFPAEDCRFVLDVLGMYRAMHNACTATTPKELREEIRFTGFDGNNESEHLGYTLYFIEDLGRFQELKDPKAFDGFNSHMHMIPQYRRMLDEFRKSSDKHALSEDDVKRIVSA